MNLRPYQSKTVSAIYDYLGTDKGSSPIAVVPTGGGKTAIYNSIIKDMLSYADTNVLMVTHRKKLIEQGAKSLLRFIPDAPISIYSAGLGSKRLGGRAVFAGIQSIWRKAYDMPRIDVCFIDEAHLVSPNGQTMYRKFLEDLRVCNPSMKLIGLSATPFRLGTGLLHEGDGALFDGIAHEVKILELINDGYLTGLVSRPASVSIDVSSVGKRGGEFIESELAAAASDEDLIRLSVAEVVHCAREQNRKRWLIFSCNIAHAELLCREYRQHDIDARIVSSKHKDSDATLEAHARGEFPALINVDMLTTGYDDAFIDLIAIKRSTMSAGLFVQIGGRGTRPLYAPGFDLSTRGGRLASIAASQKPDCLLLDYGGNIERHGFIDEIEVTNRNAGKGGGTAPKKTCSNCGEFIPASVRVCPFCSYYFKPPPPNHTHTAHSGAILSTQVEPEWVNVDSVVYARHEKAGKPPSIRVTYQCGLTRVNEWLCPDHGGYAASRYHARMKAMSAFAMNTDDALLECGAWKQPGRIRIKPKGEFFEIMQLDYNAPLAQPVSDGIDYDDIPF